FMSQPPAAALRNLSVCFSVVHALLSPLRGAASQVFCSCHLAYMRERSALGLSSTLVVPVPWMYTLLFAWSYCMSSNACTLAHLPSAQRLLPIGPLASLPLASLMACWEPQELSLQPLVAFMTKSLEVF